MLDGADCNRQFINIHFKNKDPADSKFVTTNIYTLEPMIFIMDSKVKILLSKIIPPLLWIILSYLKECMC